MSTRYAFYEVPGWRPGQMITFTECQDVLLRDVRIVDAPYWTVWPHGCDRVRITGISIINDRHTPNGDGINPDSCRDVIISDCYFNTGDDCIALRSDAGRLTDKHKPCENITVTNCVMITPCCAVRIGYVGDAPIRYCTFSNLVMVNTRTGINMLVPRIQQQADRLVSEHGPAIHHISFSNIQMDTRIGWYLWVGEEASAPGGIRDIRISGVTGTTQRACVLMGSSRLPIERVQISDVDLAVRGPMDDQLAQVPDPYPIFDLFDRPGIPHGFYARHVSDLRVRGLTLRWSEATGAWRSAVRLEQVRGVQFDSLWASAARPQWPVIDARDGQNLAVTGCSVRGPSAALLRVEGPQTRGIRLRDNDAALATTELLTAPDAAATA
jgi:hypothetical protein